MHKHSPTHIALGNVIRRRRGRLGISQEDLAHRCHFNRTYMGLIERGEVNPSLAKMLQLASGLETKLSSLITSVERDLRRDAMLRKRTQ